MVLIATVLTIAALDSQTRLGRSALRDDLAHFGVLANSKSEIRELANWIREAYPAEWVEWKEVLIALARRLLSPSKPMSLTAPLDLEPIEGLSTAYIADALQVATAAQMCGLGPETSTVPVKVTGAVRAEVIAIDHFRDAPLIRRALQSHSTTIRRTSNRDAFWDRIAPLMSVSERIIVRDRYALPQDGSTDGWGLKWLAERCAVLPERKRELTVYGTVAEDLFSTPADYQLLAEALVKASGGRLRVVRIVPVPHAVTNGSTIPYKQRPHQLPHDRVLRFATPDHQWSRRVVIGNSLSVFAHPVLNDDLTFTYCSLSQDEIDAERQIEERLNDQSVDMFTALADGLS